METKIEKPPIGLEKLVMWELINDSDTGSEYNTEPVAFYKKLMTATDTPSVSTAILEADNQIIDEAISHDGGELAIGVTVLNEAERTLMYGEKNDGGTLVTNKDDVGKYVAVAYMTKKDEQHVNLYKYPKVKFTPQPETYNTVKKGSHEYAVANLKGEYIPTLFDGNAAYRRLNVERTKDAEIIEKWFTDASFYKPAEA